MQRARHPGTTKRVKATEAAHSELPGRKDAGPKRECHDPSANLASAPLDVAEIPLLPSMLPLAFVLPASAVMLPSAIGN
jgi:hypothetical protein